MKADEIDVGVDADVDIEQLVVQRVQQPRFARLFSLREFQFSKGIKSRLFHSDVSGFPSFAVVLVANVLKSYSFSKHAKNRESFFSILVVSNQSTNE